MNLENEVVPTFEAHPWLRNGHLQTILGRYWRSRPRAFPSTYHEIRLEDGDRLAVLESVPDRWRSGDPQALLVHGLGGCARSPYVVHVSSRLWHRGVRVVRMNLRGAGLGFGLARGIYHAGRTEDLRAVAQWMAGRAVGSPMGLVGFSLGANLVLKLAAEASETPLEGLDCVVAANPPIDLAASCRQIRKAENRAYDRNFVRHLKKEVGRLHRVFPELGSAELPGAKTVFDFDDHYTSRRNGFEDADDYYRRSSSMHYIPRIEVPGLVIHAEDDPFIPAESFREITFPDRLALELIPVGGHLGYLSRTSWNGDRHWLYSRITAWLSARWLLPRANEVAVPNS